jgi:hypothetical protein
MKSWKTTVVLLILGTSFVWVAESPAGFRCRRRAAPSCYYPAAPDMPRAGDTVDLRWKFQANKPFYVQIVSKTDQTIRVEGMDAVQKQEQTLYLRVTPQKKDENGSWILGMKFIGIKMRMDIGGNKIEYDSRKPERNNPMADFFRALKGFKFKVFLGSDMAISKAEGQEEFINEISRKNPQIKPFLQSILSEETIKKSFEPIFPPVPPKPVTKGESWNRKGSNSDALGKYNCTTKYLYEGKKEGLERIKVETRIAYPLLQGGALTTPKKVLPGQILFDTARGRVARALVPLKLEGNMKIDIGGVMRVVDLSQFQTITVTVTDSNPIPKKEQ